MSKPNQSWGFYGGNTVEFDGRGYTIETELGQSIYLERNEASSLASLLQGLLFKKKKNANTRPSRPRRPVHHVKG